MRSLIVILYFAWIPLGHCLSSQVLTQLQYQSGSFQSFTNDSKTQSLRSTQTVIDYRLQGLKEYFNLSSGVVISQPDYSEYKIRHRDGSESNLSNSERSQNEYAGTVGFGFAKDSHSFKSAFLKSLNQTPFPTQRIDVGFEEGFFNQTSLLGIEYSHLRQGQPLSYFTDSLFRTSKRPEVIHTNIFGFTYEQILTKKWKSLLRITSVTRQEERPVSYGLDWSHGLVLSKKVFAVMKVERIIEDRNEQLKNERGYFDLWGTEAIVTVEPVFDLLVSGSYGLRVETEFQPNTTETTRLGVDQFGLGIKYVLSGAEVSVKGSYFAAESNSGTSVIGGVLWML